MGNPIVIDDGGSTRLKRIDPAPAGPSGVMEDLIDVKGGLAAPVPSGSKGSEHTSPASAGNYSQIYIVYQDKDGKPFEIAKQAFNNFEITSGANQTIEGTIVGTPPGRLKLTLYGSPGADPQVVSGQKDGQRRYLVSNAGTIQSVQVNGSIVYPPSTFPTGFTGPVLYTSVILS